MGRCAVSDHLGNLGTSGKVKQNVGDVLAARDKMDAKARFVFNAYNKSSVVAVWFLELLAVLAQDVDGWLKVATGKR